MFVYFFLKLSIFQSFETSLLLAGSLKISITGTKITLLGLSIESCISIVPLKYFPKVDAFLSANVVQSFL